MKLLQKSFDICKEARSNNVTVQCPVNTGTYAFEQAIALPDEIPREKFNVLVKGYTPEDDPLMCLTIDVDFMLGFPHPRQLW